MADGESPAAGAATPSQPRSSSLRDVIVNFYLEHNPSKVGSVEGILQQYKGQESLLLAQLREKYGKDPLQDADGTRTSEDHPRPMSLPPLSSIINEPPLERRVAPVAGGDAVIKVDTSRTGATGAAIRDRGSLSYEALRTKFDAVSTDCNNLAAKVALLEKQRQTSCVRQKALEEKFVELRCERDDAVQKCERKHVQVCVGTS
jgi:outer membrane murein-binding lipoprotein Lpp